MTPPAQPPVAIGDVHGRLDLLRLAAQRFPDRHLVLLGDYVDRGPDSAGVLALVRELVTAGRATALAGNHDLLMIAALLDRDPDALELWLANGGQATLDSYTGDLATAHADAAWLRAHLQPHAVIGPVLYAHAMRPDPTGQDAQAWMWGRPDDTPLYALPEGVTHSVHGHTPLQACPFPYGAQDGTVAWFIDTAAVYTGTLTALDTATWTPHAIQLPEAPSDCP